MRHILLESPDRCGKNTLIKGLCEYYNYDNVTIRHFTKPPKEEKDPLNYQLEAFENEGKLLLNFQEADNNPNQYYETIVIWNRTPLGEYIWAPLYRANDRDIFEYKDMIREYLLEYENKFLTHQNTYLINLTASAHFCASHEDGKSLGKSLTEKEKQLRAFQEMNSWSTITNKIQIPVEEGNQFRPKKDILNDVINFINT